MLMATARRLQPAEDQAPALEVPAMFQSLEKSQAVTVFLAQSARFKKRRFINLGTRSTLQ